MPPISEYGDLAQKAAMINKRELRVSINIHNKIFAPQKNIPPAKKTKIKAVVIYVFSDPFTLFLSLFNSFLKS